MSNNSQKEVIKEELEKGKKDLYILELKEHFWQGRLATAKSGKPEIESNLSQVTGILKHQREWVAFLERQEKNES